MTISVWRYSHLALAVSSFVFITLAAVTGIILACEPVQEKIPSYKSAEFGKTNIAQAIPALQKKFTELTSIEVDANQFVIVKGIVESGKQVTVYADPATGIILGPVKKKSEFFQWITGLHRSLFLHETGRFFVGLASFLLMLITISGAVLVIQRQRGVKKFFKRIVKENFAQYYHVVLGRISLIPIFLIALTGTYLSLVKFNVFPEKKVVHKIDFDKLEGGRKKKIQDFYLFKNTQLADVRSMEFPFSDDPEDYFTLKLKDRELAVDQFSGTILSEIKYPITTVIAALSLDIHTGRTSVLWCIILAIACINILFFVYSGFAITLKRTANKAAKNKYKATESRFIILAGSENGTTLRFANEVHRQLLAAGERSFFAELNAYKQFPKAEHIIVMTATYGIGDPPSNAGKFASLLDKYQQDHTIQFSVVAFGSQSYPDFCKFGFEAHDRLATQSWSKPLLDIHTVNDRSPEQFAQWFTTWSQKAGLPEMQLSDKFYTQPRGLQTVKVIGRTGLTDQSFILRLETKRWTRFSSGDLLAIYPANDHRERLYSIGRIGKEMQLSIKLHENGLGSGYLYDLKPGALIRARINANKHFSFPEKASSVVMISNGTGIAPFLGMIDQNSRNKECYLYCGFRERASFELYQDRLHSNKMDKKITQLHVAYSREADKLYVSDLLKRDAKLLLDTLLNNGVIMICGSLSMERDVIALLSDLCETSTGKSISHFQAQGQILSDCY